MQVCNIVLAGEPIDVELKPTLADGLAVRKVGSNAFAIGRHYIDQVEWLKKRVLNRFFGSVLMSAINLLRWPFFECLKKKKQ